MHGGTEQTQTGRVARVVRQVLDAVWAPRPRSKAQAQAGDLKRRLGRSMNLNFNLGLGGSTPAPVPTSLPPLEARAARLRALRADVASGVMRRLGLEGVRVRVRVPRRMRRTQDDTSAPSPPPSLVSLADAVLVGSYPDVAQLPAYPNALVFPVPVPGAAYRPAGGRFVEHFLGA